MKYKHHYEYNKTKASMNWFFASVTFLEIVELMPYYTELERYGMKQWLREQIFDCYIDFKSSIDHNFDKHVHLIVIELFEKARVTFIFIILALVCFKRTDDILQGISKLDHLIKVSIFQVYKNKGRERHKSSLFSGISLSKFSGM